MNHRINLRIALPFFALTLLCTNATAQGEEAAGVHFQHGDWEIACDNTLTCRIAGYCAAENFGEGCASVLITRAAGPDAPLAGKAGVWRHDGIIDVARLTLRIDGKSEGALEKSKENDVEFALTAAQIRALLAAARKDGVIEFVGRDDAESFTLSGKGISAVLLKADEVQGRIGTPGAFIRKGKNPEEGAFPPRSAPVIQAAKVSDAPPRELAAPEIAALKPLLRQSMEGKCELFDDDDVPDRFKVLASAILMPLSEQHVLLGALCRSGAHDMNAAYWVMNRALEGRPTFVAIGAHSYWDGKKASSIRSAQKEGDAVDGDCPAQSEWVWDGQAFRLSGKWTIGMCRGYFRGGDWNLPTFVADVRNADGTPRARRWTRTPE
jgi:invasion protein IalB